MAAFRASRLVCSAIPVIASTIPPICSPLRARSSIVSLIATDDSRTALIASVATETALAPSSAAARASAAASRAFWAFSSDALVSSTTAIATSWAPPMTTIWRSEPDATSATAWAISSIARCVSSERAGHLVGRGAQADRGVGDLADDRAQADRHLAERVAEHVVLALGGDVDDEVAGRDGLRGLGDLGEVAAHRVVGVDRALGAAEHAVEDVGERAGALARRGRSAASCTGRRRR